MIIAFEGIDACGKETQVRALRADALLRGQEVLVKSYPDYETETGKKISELLQLPDGERDGLLLQSLMTMNRYESQEPLKRAHQDGQLVILDRYWMSGLVYGQTDGLDLDWLLRVHERLLQPDYWFVLDISVEESFRRRPAREDVYEESKERLEKCRDLYHKASLWTGARIIDGHNSPEAVHEMVLTELGWR